MPDSQRPIDEVDPIDEDEYVEVPNVVAVSDGMALICQVSGMSGRVSVPYSAIHPDSPVGRAGERGTLILKKTVARDVGIP